MLFIRLLITGRASQACYLTGSYLGPTPFVLCCMNPPETASLTLLANPQALPCFSESENQTKLALVNDSWLSSGSIKVLTMENTRPRNYVIKPGEMCIKYLNLCPMFISRVKIPQPRLCQKSIVKEFVGYLLPLARIRCREVHDDTNLKKQVIHIIKRNYEWENTIQLFHLHFSKTLYLSSNWKDVPSRLPVTPSITDKCCIGYAQILTSY